MHRVAFLFLILAALCVPAQADTALTGARVTFSGEMGIGETGTTSQPTDVATHIAAAPGVRFGMELVPEGSPMGAPVVLEVRLSRPKGSSESTPALRWLVAARVGYPARSVWEFAYDWEVEPGTWVMKIFHAEKELAAASFTIVQATVPPPAGPAPPPAALEPAQTQNSIQTRSQVPAAREKTGTGPAGNQAPATAHKGASPTDENSRLASSAPAQAGPDAPTVAFHSGQALERSGDAASRQFRTPGGQEPKALPTTQSARERAVGGRPERQVYALFGGAYSQEARALWMANFLKAQGVTACVRTRAKAGKKIWTIVVGWRNSIEEARQTRNELTATVGEMLIVPMAAGELEKGLGCR
jgi:hypothetical protein